jgi:hypothetical protein
LPVLRPGRVLRSAADLIPPGILLRREVGMVYQA